MCGIVGVVSKDPVKISYAIDLLKRLEYRGYDSFGFATNNGFIKKYVGEIGKFEPPLLEANIISCHTRWATHGGVTVENAHPHSDCNNELFVVHNGIINNYKELKEELEWNGHVFKSATDTEVISHFFEGNDIKNTVVDFFNKAKGEFAVLIIRKGDDKIYALKRGSPLALGILDNRFILASDIYAFSDKTNKVIFFDEDEFAIISKDGYKFFDVKDKLIPKTKPIQTFSWTSGKEGKKQYEHYMLNEIMEQSEVADRLIDSLQKEQCNSLMELAWMIRTSKKVVFVAAGTSYHASLLGVYLFNKVNIEAHAVIASEFCYLNLVDKDSIVIAISQSGETMDVIETLKLIKAKGIPIASFVNVPYSTIQRMSDISINILAGQEVCVAATKSFTNQVILLLCLVSLCGFRNTKIYDIPKEIEEILRQNEKLAKLAKELSLHKDIYVIGRGISYPVAREIALKIKEISYIHAEGMMGGELKHGTLALIEKGTPVISLIPKDDESIVSNSKEVEARGGHLIAITNSNDHLFDTIIVPAKSVEGFCILSSVVGQLLAYYIAKEKGLPIDKPRNLAKSCTVK
ncbi:MAG: glutamine--fructose-6-phosphate transaminase (isomerizing) [bacterium]